MTRGKQVLRLRLVNQFTQKVLDFSSVKFVILSDEIIELSIFKLHLKHSICIFFEAKKHYSILTYVQLASN